MIEPEARTSYSGTRIQPSTPVVRTAAPKRRISWAAIFAGTLIALVVQLLFSLLGLGIGLSTINPASEAGNPADGLALGAGIWWVVSSLISLFAGGWVAGRLAGFPRTGESTLHGILTWGLVTIVTFYLLTTTAGALLSGAMGVVSQGLSLATQGIAAVAPQAADAVKQQLNEQGIDLSGIRQEAETLLRQTGKPALQPENLQNQAAQMGDQAQAQTQTAAQNPRSAEFNLDQFISSLFRQGQDTVAAADREAAVNVVALRTGKPRAEAAQIVDRWIAAFQTAKQKAKQAAAFVEQKARQAGEKAAAGLSTAALIAFAGLFLGACAAAFGGRIGTPRALIETSEETAS